MFRSKKLYLKTKEKNKMSQTQTSVYRKTLQFSVGIAFICIYKKVSGGFGYFAFCLSHDNVKFKMTFLFVIKSKIDNTFYRYIPGQ